MADLKLKLKEAAEKTFSLPTNQSHTLTLKPPKVFVLDAEDAHFNAGRSVLLPDLTANDGSPPVLDARRVTGLGVLYAALTHAKQNASQGVCVTGHADGAGSAGHSLGMSEHRAQGLSLLLRGKRDDWASLAAKQDAVDDYQTVLTWQNQRAGWDCDPGGINNKLNKATKAAIKRFQEAYNAEVDRVQNAGLDSPFKQKIAVDSVVGKETWGAIYDVYMSELMELFAIEKVSELVQMQQALKAPPGMPDYVGCGDHIGFRTARRDPFQQVDETLEEPAKNPPDRRVEILFFDPGEEVKLDCHPARGQCKPTECPIYTKVPHRQQPIGVPKGLSIAEVNLRLTFVDPEGKVRPFPAGLPVLAKFGTPPDEPAPPEPAKPEEPKHLEMHEADFEDSEEPADGESQEAEESAPPPATETSAPDKKAESLPAGEEQPDPFAVEQEPTTLSAENGLLQFVIPRKARSLYLRFLAGIERRCISSDPKVVDDQKLMSVQDASAAVGEGRVFWMLPEVFHTKQGYFELPEPGGVSFKDGAFLDVDVKKTQLGTREAPLELRLVIKWQYFQFEYFDRFTMSATQVPQALAGAEGTAAAAPLVLQGAGVLNDAGNTVRPPILAYSAWHVRSGKNSVHCLGWPTREAIQDKPVRALPDKNCTAMFNTTNLFVRTEGDGSSPDATRNFVTFAEGDKAPSTPGVDRLRLYDLPPEWRSRVYPARFAGDTPDKSKAFEELDPNGSTLSKPFVFSLDTIVIGHFSNKCAAPDLKWDDSDLANRLTVFDNKLQVYKADPPSAEPYFTKVDDLKPKPQGAVLIDHPPFTRLIARKNVIYDVFDKRTTSEVGFKGAPIGARLALYLSYPIEDGRVDPTPTKHLPMTLAVAPFRAARPNGTLGHDTKVGASLTAVLRCCGHEKGVELFTILQYLSVTFLFPTSFTAEETQRYQLLTQAVPLSGEPPNKRGLIRDSLLKIAARWNGNDDQNKQATQFAVGSPMTARGSYLAFLSQGARARDHEPEAGEVRVTVFKKGRAFMSGPVGYWHVDEMLPDAHGAFTAAHETGHIFANPDEYNNTDYKPSYGQPNTDEGERSAGTPYGFDWRAMMVSNQSIRARYFWDFLLFARDYEHFADASEFRVKRGHIDFTTDVTRLLESRVRYPKVQRLNLEIVRPDAKAPRGIADVFVYITGRDEFLAQDIDSFAKAKPYDGCIVVRVKMAWDVTTTDDYDDLVALMQRVHETTHGAFNVQHPLVIRAKHEGRSVRLRVLFAPRMICSTPAEEDDEQFKTYLKGIDYPRLPALNGAEYRRYADEMATRAHLKIVVKKDGTPGVTGTTLPRKAFVRADRKFLFIVTSPHFDDDLLATFGSMVGVPTHRTGSGADYSALVRAISAAMPETLSEQSADVFQNDCTS